MDAYRAGLNAPTACSGLQLEEIHPRFPQCTTTDSVEYRMYRDNHDYITILLYVGYMTSSDQNSLWHKIVLNTTATVVSGHNRFVGVSSPPALP